MAKLYAENSIVIAFEAARLAGQYAVQRKFDVHFRDACLKTGPEANVLISGHEDQLENLPKGDLPPDDAMAGEEILRQCDECESKLPKGGDVDPASLDPATILMFIQLFSQVWNFFRRKDQLAPQS